MKQLPQGQYDFKGTEEKILKFWNSKPFFTPEYQKDENAETFTIILPPPNANGVLHLGHMSGYTYQDLMGRYNRILGKKVLLLPGKDHAGIQTEVVFEKELEKKGINKLELGREKFYEMCYQFCMEMSENARSQEKRIGLSADYGRELFTLDPKIVNTVLDTFIKLFNDGYVYKGSKIVNWCIRCKTTLADIDTEHKERDAKLTYIKYPIVNTKLWKLNFRIDPIFEALKNGSKTIETRALNPEEPDKYFGDIKSGDLISCENKNTGENLLRKVKRVGVYRTYEEFFNGEDLKAMYSYESKLPTSAEELKQSYLEGISKDYAEKIEKNGIIAIEFEDLDDSEMLTTATTRPETMLGDTALVVNPEDERYAHLIGKTAIVPIVNREIPIITSRRIEKEFGTGVLKLTPAHAPEDDLIATEYEAESGHAVEKINIIWKDGRLTGPIPEKYKGMKVNAAREEIVKELQELGLVEKIEDLKQNVSVCERCKSVIEPLMSSQWFIKVDEIKRNAIESIDKGDVTIHPEMRQKVLSQWMENLRDWPVSRQLWWGYRIPVWYKGEREEFVDDNGKIIEKIGGVEINPSNFDDLVKVSQENPGEGWVQDPDVLDTWFSSGQWPYATLMAKEGDFEKFYPTQVLETAYDILLLWVSRMIMLGNYRTKQTPFENVYLHGIITAKDGQKMSKSKGNGIDPFETMDTYGTDALRYSYVMSVSPGSNNPLSEEKIKGFRNFMNKIWNASRFVMMNLEDIESQEWFDKVNRCKTAEEFKELQITNYELLEDDLEMIQRLDEVEKSYSELFGKFQFGLLSENLYNEFWHTFCDIYIEKSKGRVWRNKDTGEYSSTEESRRAAQATLFYTLKSFLKMLHPFIPFITEEIWQHLIEDARYEEALMYSDNK